MIICTQINLQIGISRCIIENNKSGFYETVNSYFPVYMEALIMKKFVIFSMNLLLVITLLGCGAKNSDSERDFKSVSVEKLKEQYQSILSYQILRALKFMYGKWQRNPIVAAL